MRYRLQVRINEAFRLTTPQRVKLVIGGMDGLLYEFLTDPSDVKVTDLAVSAPTHAAEHETELREPADPGVDYHVVFKPNVNLHERLLEALQGLESNLGMLTPGFAGADWGSLQS